MELTNEAPFWNGTVPGYPGTNVSVTCIQAGTFTTTSTKTWQQMKGQHAIFHANTHIKSEKNYNSALRKAFAVFITFPILHPIQYRLVGKRNNEHVWHSASVSFSMYYYYYVFLIHTLLWAPYQYACLGFLFCPNRKCCFWMSMMISMEYGTV